MVTKAPLFNNWRCDMLKFRLFSVFLIIFFSLLFVSCDMGQSDPDSLYKEGVEGDTGDSGKTGDTGDTGDTGNSGSSGDSGDSGDSEEYGGDSGNSGDSGEGDITQQPGQMTAAQWNDIENWNFWLGLLEDDVYSGYVKSWGFHNFDKVRVRVLSGEKPAVDVSVDLKDDSGKTIWTARTDNFGKAELFAFPFSQTPYDGELKVKVSSGQEEIEKDAVLGEETLVELDQDLKTEDILDLMFMIDTTGSMGDELEYLKAELHDVIQKVGKNYGSNLTLRLSCNFYRDEEDEYLVRSFPFSTDVEEVLSSLKKQTASGGGDRPEAVHSALENGINEHVWSEKARSRIMFLVLDAPPHLNKQGVPESIRNSVKSAAEKGIRIIPIAASGIDKSDEFFLRSIDIFTAGTYVFVTNDSGIGGDHIEPTVGKYEVMFLNDLIEKIIIDSLK